MARSRIFRASTQNTSWLPEVGTASPGVAAPMDYCRIDYARSWEVPDAVNLTIQIYDGDRTQFLQSYSGVPIAAVSDILSQVLGEGWDTVLSQQFQDWAIYYCQRPKLSDMDGVQADPEAIAPILARTRRRRWRFDRVSPVGAAAAAVLGSLRQSVKRVRVRWMVPGLITAGLLAAATILAENRLPDEVWLAQWHSHQPRPQAVVGLTTFEPLYSGYRQSKHFPRDTSQADPFNQAFALAEQAALDGQTAESTAEWRDLARRWRLAALLMAEVPDSDPRYGMAQNRTALYRTYSEAALLAAAQRSVVLPVEAETLSVPVAGMVPTTQDAALAVKPLAIAPTPSAGPTDCQTRLSSMIAPILTASDYAGSQWGIHVESLVSGQVLYQLNSDAFFVPASNIKIYTTAAALQFHQQQSDTVESAAGLIQIANLRSSNWAAELLLQSVGGPESVKDVLADLGIDPTGYHQVDGSGLSHENWATPRSLVSALVTIQKTPSGSAFLASLPISGQTGTLRHRFHGTPAYGLVYAKTGTLWGVRSLSGYLDHPVHDRLAFSILINHPSQSGYALNAPIDEIVVRLTQLDACDTPSGQNGQV